MSPPQEPNSIGTRDIRNLLDASALQFGFLLVVKILLNVFCLKLHDEALKVEEVQVSYQNRIDSVFDTLLQYHK